MEIPIDPRLRAMAHPLRLRILAMVTARPVSATEVADASGLPHAAASYHLRQLAAAGLLDVADDAPVSGAKGRPRRTYRMREGAFNGLGPEASQLLSQGLLTEIGRRLQIAGRQSSTTDAEVWLDEADWRRVRDLIDRASAIVHEKAQPPLSEGARHVAFTALLLGFED